MWGFKYSSICCIRQWSCIKDGVDNMGDMSMEEKFILQVTLQLKPFGLVFLFSLGQHQHGKAIPLQMKLVTEFYVMG